MGIEPTRAKGPQDFQFESDADVASFAIDYQLVAAETRASQDGQLHVRLTLEPPVARPSPDAVFRQTDAGDEE